MVLSSGGCGKMGTNAASVAEPTLNEAQLYSCGSGWEWPVLMVHDICRGV